MFNRLAATIWYQLCHPPVDPTAAHCVTCNKAGTRAEMHQVSALDFACCEKCVSKYVSEWGI